MNKKKKIKAIDTITAAEIRRAVKTLEKAQTPGIWYLFFNNQFPFIHRVKFYTTQTIAAIKLEELIRMAILPKAAGETIDKLVRKNSMNKKSEKFQVSKTVIGKNISVTHGKVVIDVSITPKYIEINGLNGHSFIFKSENKPITIKRWEEVLACLTIAVQEAKKERQI